MRGKFFELISSSHSLHKANNDNGIRVVNFSTSKYLIVKSTTFIHCDIHKHIWTSFVGVIHNQIDHVLIDKRRHSNILLDVRSFREADCDIEQNMVVP
jgi:hypothetical protein